MKKFLYWIKSIIYNTPSLMFKRGMYISYLKNKKYLITCRDKANYIRALSECWKKEEAKNLFLKFLEKKSFHSNRYVHMQCAQYYPEELLGYALRYGKTTLVAGIFERLEMRKELEVYLRRLPVTEWKKYPELFLYEKGWAGINTYFELHGLVPCVADYPWTFTYRSRQSSKGPLISIIMTAWNTEKFIDIAIKSIQNQTYKNWELIIVDDNSTDGTATIIENYVRTDSRITFIRQKGNAGTYAAKNMALPLCRGEFITCHDSDDYSHPEKLERQVRPLLEHSDLVASISYWLRITEQGRPYAKAIDPLLRINMSSVLFRKVLLSQGITPWDNVSAGADSKFFHSLEFIYGNHRIKRIRIPLSLGMYRGDSLTVCSETGIYAREGALKRIEYTEAWGKTLYKLYMSN